jgi:hypothetical protein
LPVASIPAAQEALAEWEVSAEWGDGASQFATPKPGWTRFQPLIGSAHGEMRPDFRHAGPAPMRCISGIPLHSAVKSTGRAVEDFGQPTDKLKRSLPIRIGIAIAEFASPGTRPRSIRINRHEEDCARVRIGDDADGLYRL